MGQKIVGKELALHKAEGCVVWGGWRLIECKAQPCEQPSGPRWTSPSGTCWSWVAWARWMSATCIMDALTMVGQFKQHLRHRYHIEA